MKKVQYFFCPASDFLNQHNETGSHGQISYQFLKSLSKNADTKRIFASVMASLKVEKINKLDLEVSLNKTQNDNLYDFDSLYFYITSFFRFFLRPEYQKADIVHHLLPFSFGRSFNLFFIFRNKKKLYVIGPIIGPHVNQDVVSDETYNSNRRLPIHQILFEKFHRFVKYLFLLFFSRFLSYLSSKTLRAADIVLFSDKHSMNYHSKFMLSSQKAIILDTGIDTSVFKPGSTKRTIRKELKVLFVGRLTKRKGCQYLIEAMSLLKNKNLKLTIICNILGEGPEEKKLKELVNKYQLKSNVFFLGGVPSNDLIAKYYQNSDVVCLPALSETFTVTKEALSCGTPVIVTNICSNAERISNLNNGIVIPPKSAKKIAESLLLLADNPELLTKLKLGATRQRNTYDWDHIVNQYVALLTDV